MSLPLTRAVSDRSSARAAKVPNLQRELATCAVAAVAPAGHVRVVDAVAGGVAGPYLRIGARVTRLTHDGDDAGPLDAPFHSVLLGRRRVGVRPDDADLIVWDGGGGIDPRWLASRLAPGGVLVLPRSCSSALVDLELRAAPAATDEVMLAYDRRPARPIPDALLELDRTMCVDRSRVLAALSRTPWIGPTAIAEDASALTAANADLLAALRTQLRWGEPDVRTLPWPEVTTRSDAAPGCDVLAIMPHPDDETIYAGGTIAGLSRAGKTINVVVATDGAGGRGGPDLGRRRAVELLEATRILGVASVQTLTWQDTGKYRDAERTEPMTAADAITAWTLRQTLSDLIRVIREHRPTTVLTLDPELDPNLSLHGHHLALGVLVAVAFHLAADPEVAPAAGPAWAAAEHRVIGSPYVASEADDVVAVDAATKRRALQAHASQSFSTQRLLETLQRQDVAHLERTRAVQVRRAVDWTLAVPAGPPGMVAPSDGWRARAERVATHPRDRDALVDLLTRQAGSRPADAAVDRSLQTLRRPDAVAVVTGQQVGWLGGPGYALVKALAAVALARRLQAQGIATVPVFWMATQDHDLPEVAAAPTLEGEKVRLAIEDRGRPVGDLSLPSTIDEANSDVLATLPASRRALARDLIRHAQAGTSFAEAFARLLAELTHGTGLLILDPSDEAFARLAAPIYARELLGATPAAVPLHDSAAPAVVPIDRDVSQVFFVDDTGRRQRLTRTETGVCWPAGAMDRAALERILVDAPQRLSPAALLRPLVADHVLPVIASVAGPTESRYLAQMQPLYAWADVPPSHVVTRPSVVPIASADARVLARFGGPSALRRDANASVTIGRLALPARARRWLRRLDALAERVAQARAEARSGRRPDLTELRDGLAALMTDATASLEDLRSAESWPAHRQALVALLDPRPLRLASAGPRPSRDLTRVLRRLGQIRASLLRDGRRRVPEAIAAWRRVAGPVERRMTTVEWVARFGRETPTSILAALSHLDGSVVELYGSAAR